MHKREVLTQNQIEYRLKDKHSRNYFGYGRWNSPYWFIGLESGGKEREDISISAWEKMGMGELLDCKLHHFNMGIDKHHKDNPVAGQTFRKLIKIFLAFKNGKEPHIKEINEYMKSSWGSATGETLVINISATPAQNIKIKVKNRDKYHEDRISYIIQKIKENKPVFVIIYGKAQFKYWSNLNFDSNYNSKIGDTIIKGIMHPAYRYFKEKDCIETGMFLRLKT